MTKKTARRGKPAQKTQKQVVDPDELFDTSARKYEACSVTKTLQTMWYQGIRKGWCCL